MTNIFLPKACMFLTAWAESMSEDTLLFPQLVAWLPQCPYLCLPPLTVSLPGPVSLPEMLREAVNTKEQEGQWDPDTRTG